MRKLYLLGFLLIFLVSLSRAQTFTTVTGTITDLGGQTWNYGSITAELQTTKHGTPLNDGHPITDSPQVVALSSSGTFSFTVDDNSHISPVGSFWNFTVCPNASASCVVVGFAVSGGSQNISTTINPHLNALSINMSNTPVLRAYNDTEAVGGNGALYWRTTDNTLRGCQATPAQTCGGGGSGVWTSIVSGGGITNLTALFGITLTPNPATTTATIALTNASVAPFQMPFVDATGTTLNWVTPGTNGCYLGLNTSSGPFWDGNLCSTLGTPNNLTYNGTITATSFIGTGPYYLNTVIPASPPTPTASQSAFAVGSDGNWYLSNNGGAFAQILTGSGGSGVIGTGTNNTVTKWTGTSTIGNSQLTDDGTDPTLSPLGFNIGTSAGYDYQAVNNTVTGTTINTAACDDGTGKAIICPHTSSTTNQPLGFVVSGNGTSGNSTLCNLGWCQVKFDNSTTARHYAIGSTTVDGELHDNGASVVAGQPNYFVVTANGGAGNAGFVRLLTSDDFVNSSVSVYKLQINGTALTAGDTVNFNATTPAAPTNGYAITIATSKASTTDSVSLALVGDGNVAHCLLGTGVFGACGSGTVTSVTIAGTANQITATGVCTITTSGTCTLSLPSGVILGTDNSAAGTLQLANGSANAHTIWGSGATTTNTILGFTSVPANGHIVTCTVSGSTCTLTDGGSAVGGTQANNIKFDQCTPGQQTNPGNAFWTVNQFAATGQGSAKVDMGSWQFVFNTAADVFCTLRVPHNYASGGSVIADFGANDNTASHTVVYSEADIQATSYNTNVGNLTANATTCTVTTTTTAYSNTECTYTVQSSLSADALLVVQIHQVASSSVTANENMQPPQFQYTGNY